MQDRIRRNAGQTEVTLMQPYLTGAKAGQHLAEHPHRRQSEDGRRALVLNENHA